MAQSLNHLDLNQSKAWEIQKNLREEEHNFFLHEKLLFPRLQWDFERGEAPPRELSSYYLGIPQVFPGYQV